MGQTVPNGDLNSAILSRLAGLKRGTVVSTNAIVDDVEDSFRDQKTAPELARLVSEAAMLLGLVPVYDPARARTRGFTRRSYFQPWMAAQIKH
jgi:hypothetical protein